MARRGFTGLQDAITTEDWVGSGAVILARSPDVCSSPDSGGISKHAPTAAMAQPEVASLFDHRVDAGAERRSDAAPHQSSARQVTTYSNAAIASTTAARIEPASATSGRPCALTAPTHCPMITNLEISPRTSTRNLCVRNFVQSHDPSKIALPQTGQKYQDSLAITLGPGLGLLPHIVR